METNLKFVNCDIKISDFKGKIEYLSSYLVGSLGLWYKIILTEIESDNETLNRGQSQLFKVCCDIK